MNLNNRKFYLWFYHITHSEAIIRSPKNNEFEKNIDIYLGDIQYIEVPAILAELKLEDANEQDVIYLRNRIGKEIPLRDILVMVSEGRKYYIVASVCKMLETSLERMEVPVSIFMKGEKN